MIELRHLHAFVAVAEELHFGHAAKRLRVAQPAISRDIGALERVLGLKFFKRSTRSVELTDAGRRFYATVADPVRQVDQALHLAKLEGRGAAGSLRISYGDFALNGPMFRIVHQFRSAFSNIEIELIDSYTDMQIDWLTEERIDAGFMIGPINAPHLKTFTINTERLMVVLPSSHPLAQRASIALEDLAEEPFILGSSQCWRSFRHLVDTACADRGFTPKVVYEPSTSDAIFGLVKVGMGLTLYVESRSQMGIPGVVFVPLAGDAPTVETTLAWNPKNTSAILPRFLNAAKAHCELLRAEAA